MAKTKQINKIMEGDIANEREKLRFAAIELEMIKPFKRYCNIDMFR